MSPYSTDRPRNYDNVGKLASGCKRVGCVARDRVQRVAQPFTIERFHQQAIQSGGKCSFVVFHLDVGGEREHARTDYVALCISSASAR